MNDFESTEDISEIYIKEEPLEYEDKVPSNAKGVNFDLQYKTFDTCSEDSNYVKIANDHLGMKVETDIEEKSTENHYKESNVELEDEDNFDLNNHFLSIGVPESESPKELCENIKDDFQYHENLVDGGYASSSSGLTSSNLIKGEIEVLEGVPDVCLPFSFQLENIFNCPSCSYCTKVKGNFQRHLLIHTKIKLFKCSECSYECNQKTSLQAHVLIHSDTKYFRCSECTYDTKWKKDLQRHMLSHSNTKMYKCSECSYESNQKCNLKSHSVIHSNTKIFKCPECKYECKRKANLKEHVLVHSNTKLFTCSKCSYKTNWKKDLNKHELIHTNTKLFKCTECKYGTNWKKDLKKHMKVHLKKNR